MRTSINNKRTAFSLMASATLIAVTPLLASCASSGFYYMSDDWCARHLEAGAARCPENQTIRSASSGPGIREPGITEPGDTQRSGLASR